MKKRIKNLNFLLMLGFVLGMSSCTYIDYSFFDQPSTSFTPFRGRTYIWISSTDSAFLRGEGTSYDSIDNKVSGIKLSPDLSNRTYFVDARSSEGYSNWSFYKENYVHDYEDINSYAGGFIPIVTTSYDERFKATIALITPPAHLHLVLHAVDENPVGKIPGKTWDVVSIKDENGQSLESDPHWESYKDNRMRFRKTNSFVLWLGEDRTPVEKQYFGNVDSINGTYSVYMSNPYSAYDSKDYLSLTFPGHKERFEILKSDWDSITITGTVEGTIGTMKLIPKD